MRLYILYILPALFLLNACANVKPPTGGPKDLDPPVMIKTNPAHRSINFKNDRITLFFDEQVESKNLMSELIITPDDDIQYKELPKRTSITIKFKDTLRSNTTYNFNFGNAIIDITEKNPCQNATLAFSTGPDIDTAFIKGNVKDMYTQSVMENVIVVLHFKSDTVDVQKHKPSYLSRVDEEGNFLIDNLPLDTFLLYAIQDNNGNLLYNPGPEKVARFPEPVVPSFDTTEYSFFLSPQNTKPFRLMSVKNEWNYSEVKFNKGVFEYRLSPDTSYHYITSRGRSLNLFHPYTITDSIQLNVFAQDSNGFEIDTTMYLATDTIGDTLQPDFIISYLPENQKIKSIPDSVVLDFNIPFKTFKIDSFLAIRDAKDTLIISNTNPKALNNNKISLKLDQSVNEVFYMSGINDLFVSKYNDTLRRFSVKYSIAKEEEFGRIEGNVKTDENNIILQLITPAFKVVESQEVNGPFVFEYIEPGTYKLRAIVDSNNNGKWDAGNHYENIQPEKVIISDEEILLKANWIVQDRNVEF